MYVSKCHCYCNFQTNHRQYIIRTVRSRYPLMCAYEALCCRNNIVVKLFSHAALGGVVGGVSSLLILIMIMVISLILCRSVCTCKFVPLHTVQFMLYTFASDPSIFPHYTCTHICFALYFRAYNSFLRVQPFRAITHVMFTVQFMLYKLILRIVF